MTLLLYKDVACTTVSRLFSSSHCPDQIWDQPASYPEGTSVLSLGVKQAEHEARLLPSFTHYVCMVWCLVKDQEQIYLHKFKSVSPVSFSGCCGNFITHCISLWVVSTQAVYSPTKRTASLEHRCEL